MNDQANSMQSASSPQFLREGAALSTPQWHLGWALGAVATGAGLLATLGTLSSWSVMALACGAAPGLVGYFWRPAGRARVALLGLWALGAVLAATFEGGLTGPLALWCVTPLLAGILLGAPAEGVGLAVAAIAVTLLLQVGGVALAAPAGAFAIGLSVAGLLMLGGATATVLAILADRGRERAAAASVQHAWLSDVISELPHLALALDRDGRPEAAFGAVLPGLEVERLQDGLVEAAHPDDRDAVQAALRQGLDQGSAEAVFRPNAQSDRSVAMSLGRRSDGLTAVVRELGELPVAQPAAAPAEAAAIAPEPGAAARISDLEAKLKAAESARADADANAMGKSRFLANMSHELRTPLNAIMGFSDIMRAKMFGELPGKYAEYAELIHESGRHLTDLINDVLDMSKIEAERYTLSREVFDAREAINAALRLVRLQADEAGVQLRGLSPAQPLMVDADRRAMKQIVLNLVSNALKFTPRGGLVTVTGQAAGGAFELVVADTGVGIAKDDLDRLGQPFEQAGDAEHRSQGTGLGLSLVKAFARLHGGEMNIESELGEGVAVTVRLPVLAGAAPQPRASQPAGFAPPQENPAPVSITPSAGEPTESFRPRMGEVIPLNLPR